MKVDEKINYLRSNHRDEYLKAIEKAKDIVSDRHIMRCCCGSLATGLHESRCSKYFKKVESEAVKSLAHLLPKAGKGESK